MLFVLVACASLLLAGIAGIARAHRMPELELTTAVADPSPSPSALARIYGRPIPKAWLRTSNPKRHSRARTSEMA